MGPMARAIRSFTDWCRRRLRRIRRRSRRAIAVELIQTAKPNLPQPETDWDCRDVLVGSFRSREQFQDNLSRNYYYLPADFLEGEPESVRYVALYQSQRFFQAESGIRYYGKVLHAKWVTREEIDFPGDPYQSGEPYYIFVVDGWQTLPQTISVKDEGVYAPRKTSLFLLQNCTRSFELFHIRRDEDFRLMDALDRASEELRAAKKITTVYPICENRFLVTVKNHFLLTDSQGNILSKISAGSFARNTRNSFHALKKHL